jgi:hypothetical protein
MQDDFPGTIFLFAFLFLRIQERDLSDGQIWHFYKQGRPQGQQKDSEGCSLIFVDVHRHRPGPRAHPSAREAGALPEKDRLMFYGVAAPAPLSLGRAARVVMSRVPAHGQGAVTSDSLLKCPETEEREGGSRVRIPLPPPLFR